jgi:hypothetical protein
MTNSGSAFGSIFRRSILKADAHTNNALAVFRRGLRETGYLEAGVVLSRDRALSFGGRMDEYKVIVNGRHHARGVLGTWTSPLPMSSATLHYEQVDGR